jgi:dUTP pyrophosphatase
MYNDPNLLNAFTHVKNNMPGGPRNFAIMKLAVPDTNLNTLYYEKIFEHNHNLMTNPFMDSGFDLYVPKQTVFTDLFKSVFIDFEVKAEMVFCDVDKNEMYNTPFYIHPRSSISKTPLMLANHTGVIDSGYRGSLIGAFRWLAADGLQYTVEKHMRLVQICHPSLCPIYVILSDENNLSNTVRGSGGFGSTGIYT